MKRDRNIIEEVYDDLCLKGKYDEKYAWKQRVGNFDSGDRETSYKGGSLNICEYLSRRMRNYRYETHIVFTRKNRTNTRRYLIK